MFPYLLEKSDKKNRWRWIEVTKTYRLSCLNRFSLIPVIHNKEILIW